jgi:cysteine-rich repeat protein
VFILAFVRTLLLLLVATACVRSDSTVCAGGQVCAGDQICVRATDTVTVCADPGQRAPCAGAGVPDGDPCDDGLGRCYDGTCLPVTCGDRLVDPVAEQCDDGNNIPGDDCSADCRSNETCGNGVVDPIELEVCDDGNLVGHDGCSDGCTPESPRWQEIEIGSPRPDRSLGMAYLPSRGRVVVLVDDAAERSTWEWNGTGWRRIATTVAPANRQEFAAVADPARDVFVVIGGSSGGSASLPDLWELDNDRWSLVTSTQMNRTAAAATYDPRRGRVLVFGGRDDFSLVTIVHDDLLEWDGTTATPVAQSSPWPGGRWGAAMAYDPRRDEVVLYGGRDNTEILDDTWTLQGTTWTRHAVSGPGALSDARMFVDGTGVVLYGGSDGSAGLADAWRWTGTQWTALGPQGPGRRISPGLAYDTARGRTVLFGGSTDGNTWELAGEKWVPVTTLAPPVGEYLAAAYDPLRHQGLVVSGAATMAMRDGSWITIATAPIPNRSAASMVFDSARDRAVLFGGVASGGTIVADTRVLSPGATSPSWASAGTVTSPSARTSTAMAYDSDRSVTVLFGGNDGLAPVDDTWELDTDWRRRMPATSPAKRSNAVLGYDPVRKKTLLFGGTDFASQPLGDTWEWDGTTWTELQPVGRTPPARSDATLTWNPGRRRLTLISGRTGFGVIDDAWEWTGQAWDEITPLATPGARAAHIAVPASDASGLYVIAGGNLTGVLGDQWLLSWVDDDRTYERCVAHHDRDGDGLEGCADPDCWWACTPLCTPTLPCAPSAPRCGDGIVAPAETCQLCPADVTACPLCGNGACETSETAASCPGDCP